MSWDSIGRSVERDVERAVIVIAAGLVALGGAIAVCVDWLWRRHR